MILKSFKWQMILISKMVCERIVSQHDEVTPLFYNYCVSLVECKFPSFVDWKARLDRVSWSYPIGLFSLGNGERLGEQIKGANIPQNDCSNHQSFDNDLNRKFSKTLQDCRNVWTMFGHHHEDWITIRTWI